MQAWAASTFTVTADKTVDETYTVTSALVFDTGGFTYTVTGKTAVSVKSGGVLQLASTGALESTGGAGVEVLSGGTLQATNSGLTVKGTTYGLDIASGAKKVELSGGTFMGAQAAIWTADNNYKALLKSGYAFFDASGNPIPLDDMSTAKTAEVKMHTDHTYHYEAVPYNFNSNDHLSHHGTCIYCGEETLGECAFSFDGNGLTASCDTPGCTHTITIEIESSYVYDGTEKPDAGFVTVTLDNGTDLAEGTHYSLSYTPRANVGVISVIVKGIIYTGTFTMDCLINPFEPTIEWEGTSPPVTLTKVYDGDPIDCGAVLPYVRIKVPEPLAEEGLKSLLQFSYLRTDAGGAGGNFTPGLPTDAGTY